MDADETERCCVLAASDGHRRSHQSSPTLLCSAPQDLWLPPPLHRRLQHGPRCSPEAAAIVECPRHPAPLLPAQGLLCLRIGSRAPLISLVKVHSSAGGGRGTGPSLLFPPAGRQPGPAGEAEAMSLTKEPGRVTFLERD